MKILVPIGKEDYKLSYDKENINKPDKNYREVLFPQLKINKYKEEAKIYVNNHFKDNVGDLDNFIYPINHKESREWLKDFVLNRLKYFGKYQDTINSNVMFGYHSVISPLLNVGLIIFDDIYKEINKIKNIPINSYEGFIRQIIGWREGIRYLYQFHYDKFYKSNFLNHKNKISHRFWNVETGLAPVDNCITKAIKFSYLHHIERLMIIGQFLLLTFVDPKYVFDWFITFVSIDAYQWVMYPNIYGMIMFADGGYMMNRPYFSTSLYIKKMSNYNLNKDSLKLKDGIYYKWDIIWDSLYYNFINTHYSIFKNIYFLSRNLYHWDNKSKKEKDLLLKISRLYLDYLYK